MGIGTSIHNGQVIFNCCQLVDEVDVCPNNAGVHMVTSLNKFKTCLHIVIFCVTMRRFMVGYCLGRDGLGGALMTSEFDFGLGLDWGRKSRLFLPAEETLPELSRDSPLIRQVSVPS